MCSMTRLDFHTTPGKILCQEEGGCRGDVSACGGEEVEVAQGQAIPTSDAAIMGSDPYANVQQ